MSSTSARDFYDVLRVRKGASKDDIKAGPFLDLLGDSNKLASYLRQSTLAKVLSEQPTEASEEE